MGIIKIEKAKSKISDAPIKLRVFVLLNYLSLITLYIYYAYNDSFLRENISSLIIIGIIIAVVSAILMYEFLVKIRSSKQLSIQVLFFISFIFFTFILTGYIGLIISLIIEFYVLSDKRVRDYFR